MAEILGAFVLGFFGSAHCVGMCGAFVMSAGGMAARSRRRIWMLGAYFGGKTLTYVLLGIVAGAIGSIAAATLSGYQATLSILVGVLLILTGIGLLGLTTRRFPGKRIYAELSRASARMMRGEGASRMFGLGMLNGFLPCGMVYAVMMIAGVTGGVLTGAAAMAAFGLATVPALAVVGWSVGWMDRTGLRRFLPQMGAVLVIIMGVLAIARATPLVGIVHQHSGHDATDQMEVMPEQGHGHGH